MDPTKATIAGLAKTAGLEPKEAAKWLSWEDPTKPGKLNAQQNQAIIDALSDPTKTVADIFGKNYTLWVPNRIVAYWGGEGGSLGRYWVNWDADMSALQKFPKGYKVLYAGYTPKVAVNIPVPELTGNEDTDAKNYADYQAKLAKAQWESGKKNGWKDEPWTAAQFEKMLADGTANKSLQGVVVWGHGGKDGFLLNASVNGEKEAEKYFIKYDAWQDAQKYKLGVGIIYACLGSYAQSADRIKAGKNVFSTTGIFWGTDKTLIPPLAPPAVQKVLRKLPQIELAPEDTNWALTGNPPSVEKILKDHKGIQ